MKKTGIHSVDPAEKDNHAANFDKALRKALDQWEQGDPTEVYVVFTATIAKNPGGITNYKATITTDAPTGPPA
jgi:hypothetical protein